MRYSDFSPLSVVLMSLVPSTKVHAWGGECREQLCSAIVRISDRLQFLILQGETVSLCSQVGVNHNGGHLLVEARDLFVVSKLMKGGTFSRNTLPASSDPPLHDCALGMRGDIFSRIQSFDW